MLHIKFQASEPSGSEVEDFLIFYAFLWFESMTPGGGHLGLWDLYSIKYGKGPPARKCYIRKKIMHLSQAILEKKTLKTFQF